jgi:hypothetical protein
MSRITIPLGVPASSAATGSTGLALSLGASSAKQGVVTAAAAAVALKDPGTSLEKAKLARDDPGEVIDPALINDTHLRKIISAVEAARENPSDAKLSNDIVVAARAAGADPRLSAAAFAVVNTDSDALTHGINWVAALDGPLLERTARAAARETLLGRVPDQLTRLSRLEERMDALEQQQLKQRIETLEKKVAALEAGTGGGSTAGGGTTRGTEAGGGTGADTGTNYGSTKKKT